jgi:hypothetical protein
MSRARNLADLLDANGDVASGALDNVPPSNDASALTTGTLPIARIADGDITAAKLGSTLDLSGKTVTLPSGNIVQVSRSRNHSGGSSTSTSYYEIGSASWATFTPLYSNSLIIACIELDIGADIDNDGQGYVIADLKTERHHGGSYYSTMSEWSGLQYDRAGSSRIKTTTWMEQFTSNTTSQIALRFYQRVYASSNGRSLQVHGYPGHSVLWLEVKQ